MDDFKFYYQFGPIDYFEAFMPLKEFVRNCFLNAAEIEADPGITIWLLNLGAAMHRLPWWEGDMKEIYVFPAALRTDFNGADVAVVWKQKNNGTCFCVSPVEIPSLREYQITLQKESRSVGS